MKQEINRIELYNLKQEDKIKNNLLIKCIMNNDCKIEPWEMNNENYMLMKSEVKWKHHEKCGNKESG